MRLNRRVERKFFLNEDERQLFNTTYSDPEMETLDMGWINYYGWNGFLVF